MAETFVQVNIPVVPGAKLKTYSSVDGGANTVESEAVTLTDGDGAEVKIYPPAELANGAETAVSAIAVEVLAANADRKEAVIQNTGDAVVRVGVAGVTASTGIRLRPGASVTFEMPHCHVGAVYAIREGASDSVVLAIEAA